MINSESVGDPSKFRSLAFLEEQRAVLHTPRDAGHVRLIVSRGLNGQRQTIDRVTMTPESGMPGDTWGRRQGAASDTQLTVIQIDVAELVAHGQPLPLFGDNLFLELDLSTANLPPGSRVRAGTVVLEVTLTPHNGCSKFNARFGNDALRFVSKKELRPLNLRGIYMRVVQAGEMSVGDRVEVLSR